MQETVNWESKIVTTMFSGSFLVFLTLSLFGLGFKDDAPGIASVLTTNSLGVPIDPKLETTPIGVFGILTSLTASSV